MINRKVLLLVSVILMTGCGRNIDVSEDTLSSLTLSVKSSEESAPVTSLKVWAFDCDAQGKVGRTANIGYASADEQSTLTLTLDTESRYCLLLAGANLPAGFSQGLTFPSLTSTMFSGLPGATATHWAVVDLTATSNGQISVPVEVFPTYGTVSVNVSKESDAMDLRIEEVNLLSSGAPEQGAFFSSLTAEEIKAGGLAVDSWYFNNLTFPASALSTVLASDVDVTESKRNVALCSENIYENQAGWTDLTAFRQSGWALNPAETDPDCNGYYLSVTYTYAISPASLDSDEAVTVQKYIPLAPVCRSNEYRFDIKVNLDEIVVFGSTESSEEIGGIW